MTGIYIHIPFCLRKCPYCSFYSVKNDDELKERYTRALVRNILSFQGQEISADTVYFGGGTPSLLTPQQVSRILSSCMRAFKLADPEITLEANPCTLNEQKLKDFKSAGINRLSLGIQSADDIQLKFLGRLHDSKTAQTAAETAYKTGFENISGDIMLGLKGQDIQSLESTVAAMCAMPLSHISAYMLKIEENTAFDSDRIRAVTADEELMCELYLKTAELLESRGFEHYEISNFAKNGRVSRHNLKYWQGEEYLGFGAAAHSFFCGRRYRCFDDINAFISSKVQPTEILEESVDRAEEYILLGLRLKEGISLDIISKLYSPAACERLAKKAELYQKAGLVSLNGDRLSLTVRGFLVSNSLIAGFIEAAGS